MRFLMLFVIGFAIGCAVGIWFLGGVWILLMSVLCFIAWVILRTVNKGNRVLRFVSLITVGAAIGASWIFLYDALFVNPARQLDGVTRTVTIEVTDYAVSNLRGSSGKGKAEISGKTFKVYFYLSENCKLKPGDKISGSFSFRFTGFGGENDPTYHQGNGIFLTANAVEQIHRYRVDQISAKYFAVVLRKSIIDKIDSIFPEDVSGFVCSLLLGDTSNLSDEDDVALKVSGIRHIVAVSGLHISILMSFVYIFVRERRFINSVVGIPLLLVFCALAGFTPSVIRACIMQIVIIIGSEIEKEYDAPTALSLAVLVLVVLNPLVITSVSFQLSVCCVIGILLFSQKIHDYLLHTKLGPAKGKSLKSRLTRMFIRSVSVTLSTMATTIPISAYYFGSVSLISVISNFLLLWLVTCCFYGVTIGCILGFIFPVAGAVMAAVVSWLVRAILFAAKLLAKIPYAAVSASNLYIFAWIVLVYLLLIVFLLSKHKKPILFCGTVITGLAISLLFATMEPRLDNYRVTVLDVGQGQCILVQSKDSCYMIDCGGFSDYAIADLAAQTLRTCGIGKIDGLILTHFDDDHAGNAEAFMYQIGVDRIYVPASDFQNSIRSNLVHEHSGILQNVRNQTTLKCGKGKITIYPGEPGKEGNESSLCILFQAKNCDILITGDRNNAGERYLIDQAELPDIDILVAGHHGAKSSTSLYLMQNLRPRMVAISVGEDNRYGHPDPIIINRLENFNCIIWRTDRDGTIVFRG